MGIPNMNICSIDPLLQNPLRVCAGSLLLVYRSSCLYPHVPLVAWLYLRVPCYPHVSSCTACGLLLCLLCMYRLVAFPSRALVLWFPYSSLSACCCPCPACALQLSVCMLPLVPSSTRVPLFLSSLLPLSFLCFSCGAVVLSLSPFFTCATCSLLLCLPACGFPCGILSMSSLGLFVCFLSRLLSLCAATASLFLSSCLRVLLLCCFPRVLLPMSRLCPSALSVYIPATPMYPRVLLPYLCPVGICVYPPLYCYLPPWVLYRAIPSACLYLLVYLYSLCMLGIPVHLCVAGYICSVCVYPWYLRLSSSPSLLWVCLIGMGFSPLCMLSGYLLPFSVWGAICFFLSAWLVCFSLWLSGYALSSTGLLYGLWGSLFFFCSICVHGLPVAWLGVSGWLFCMLGICSK